VRELLMNQPIFIGFKVDRQLRERLVALDDANRKYFSTEGSNFLRICGFGEDLYIGKLVDDRLTTDRVEDIRRNILSIIRKVDFAIRLPTHMQILGCSSVDNGRKLTAETPAE